MEQLKNELKNILINDLKLQNIAPEDIHDNDPLFGDGLGLDSLDAVELVVLLKKKYGIQIKDMKEGQVAFASLNTLAEYISQRRNG